MSDHLTITSRVHAKVEEAGKLVSEVWTRNFLTELGEAYLADRLSDRNETDGDIDGIAIGTGSGQNRASTALANSVFQRAATVAQGTAADDNDIIYTGPFATNEPSSPSTITITEGALFSKNAAGGTMINYFEFRPGIVKTTSQTLTITVTITVGAS